MSEESLHEAGESLPPPPSLSHPSSSALSSPPAADTPNSNGNSSNRMSRRLSRSSLFPEDDIDVQVPALQRLGIAGARSEDSSPAMSDAFPIQSALKSNSTNKESNSKSASFAPAPKGSDKQRVAFEEGDDNASRSSIGNIDGVKPKKANLSIRLEDEARIIASLHNAAKKQTTGSIYSVIVDLSRTGTLDIGVKDLSDNILVVSLLKRHNDRPGAGEEAGIRLGDVIFGVNFFPVREGSKTLIEVIKGDAEKKKKFLHIQAWRCHQLCSDDIPGYIFPRADEMIVQSYALFRSKVFGEWERWNFVEIILGHLVEDLRMRSQQLEDHLDLAEQIKSPNAVIRARQMQVLDLERNILQAKGLRTALNVRIVNSKQRDETVVYILRVEDVESGYQWLVEKRYNDFYSMYEELLDMTSFIKDVEFPKKRLALRLSAKLVESRIAALENFIRKALHTLTLYACMDSSASLALRHLQNFLSIDKHIDCVHPPTLDDQRTVEIMAYRFLNDFNSPACQQCVRFTQSVDLESMVEAGEDGYKGLLTFMHDALAEVEAFVQQQHEQQLLQVLQVKRPEWTADQRGKLVRQCIRRQVESALYLPLRRVVFRLLHQHLQTKLRKLHRAILVLQQAKPSVFMVDINVQRARTLPRAITAFRKAFLTYLPADQGQFLIDAALSISELHGECREMNELALAAANESPRHSLSSSINGADGNVSNQSINDLDTKVKTSLSRRQSENGSAHSQSDIPSQAHSPVDSHLGLSRTKINTGVGRKSSRERRPSLQERIKYFVESETTKVNLSEEEEDTDEHLGSQKVSFQINPNSITPSAYKKLKNDKQMAELTAAERTVRNLEDFESFLDAQAKGLTPIKENKPIPSSPSKDFQESSSGKMRNAQQTGGAVKDTKPVPVIRSKGDDVIDPLFRPPENDDFKLFADVFDNHRSLYDGFDEAHDERNNEAMIKNAISADDFLPLFTYVLVHCSIPQLYLLKEIMISLISNEDAYGECGYYLATMEAAIEHIIDLASQYEGIATSDGFYDDGEDIYDFGALAEDVHY